MDPGCPPISKDAVIRCTVVNIDSTNKFADIGARMSAL